MLRPKVLFISPSAYLLGGVATWLDYIDVSLSERGWDVVLGLVEGPRYHRPGEYVAVHPHRNTLAVPCMTGTPEGRAQAVEKAIRETIPDLVAGVNIPDVYSAVGRMRKNKRPSPRVAMALHGIQADLFGDILRYKNVLDGVVGVNRLCCRLAHQMGQMEKARIHYAPCGVVVEQEQEVRKRQKDKLVIAWVGRLEQEQKRIDDIVPIVHELVELAVPFEFLIAGAGPDEARLRQGLEEQVRTGCITFLGNISPAEVREKVYAKAHVLLVTSVWETGPLVAWEAMAARVGVVSSRYVGSGAEKTLTGENNALIFPIGDTHAAAQCLKRLWQEPGLLTYLTEKAYTMVRERYSIDASVGLWDEAFHRILEAGPQKDTDFELPVSTSRLDTYLGSRIGEHVRKCFKKMGPDSGPAGEWPHTHGRQSVSEADFLERLHRDEFGMGMGVFS